LQATCGGPASLTGAPVQAPSPPPVREAHGASRPHTSGILDAESIRLTGVTLKSGIYPELRRGAPPVRKPRGAPKTFPVEF